MHSLARGISSGSLILLIRAEDLETYSKAQLGILVLFIPPDDPKSESCRGQTAVWSLDLSPSSILPLLWEISRMPT